MKVLSIINLKGGVAKTISSVNMAHILAAGQRQQDFEPPQLQWKRDGRGYDAAGH